MKRFVPLLILSILLSSASVYSDSGHPVLSSNSAELRGGPINELYWVVKSVENKGVVTASTRTLVHQSSPARYDGENHSFSISVTKNHSFSGTINVGTGVLNGAIGYTYNGSVTYTPGNSISVKKGQYVKFYTREAREDRKVTQKQMNYNTTTGKTTETGLTSVVNCSKVLSPSIEMDVYNSNGSKARTYVFKPGYNGYSVPQVIFYE